MTNYRNALILYKWPLLWLAILVQPVAAAPPQVSYLYPAGAMRGESVTIHLGGSFSHWPPQAWASDDGLTAEPLEKKEQVQITAAADASPGIYWLRFFDQEGASSPRPFVVGSLPEQLDDEPNDDPRKPQPIGQSSVVNGRLGKRDDVDTYAFELAAGQTLVAALAANTRLASPMDAVMQICNAEGFVLAQNNDARGLDPLLVFAAPQAGIFLVRIFAFPSQPNSTIGFAGGDDYVYRLTLTNGGFLQRTMPLAVPRGEEIPVELVGWNFASVSLPVAADANASWTTVFSPEVADFFRLPVVDSPIVLAEPEAADSAQRITLPADISGYLARPAQTHAFRFTAEKNQKLQFRVESRSLGFPLDAVLELVEAESGQQLDENDDADKQADAALSQTVKADGEYEIRIRDLYGRGGERFAYRLIAEPVRPGFRLSVAQDSLLLKAGESVEVPVKIERENGHAAEIEIAAMELPAGITSAPVTSAGEGETAKEVKLRLTAEADAVSGPFRIRGSSIDGEGVEQVATFTVAGFPDKLERIWLTVPADK